MAVNSDFQKNSKVFSQFSGDHKVFLENAYFGKKKAHEFQIFASKLLYFIFPGVV